MHWQTELFPKWFIQWYGNENIVIVAIFMKQKVTICTNMFVIHSKKKKMIMNKNKIKTNLSSYEKWWWEKYKRVWISIILTLVNI